MTWYKDGLRFKCTECGQCCTGSPGYVWVTIPEIEAMAKEKGLNVNEFSMRYVRRVGNRYSLVERKNYDCIFLDGKRCTIYKTRPKQCRTYPWWPMNLKSKKEWDEMASVCEGVNHPDGELVPFGEIERQRLIEENDD